MQCLGSLASCVVLVLRSSAVVVRSVVVVGLVAAHSLSLRTVLEVDLEEAENLTLKKSEVAPSLAVLGIFL